MRITVTAWNNGGLGYGMDIRRSDVRLFQRKWGTVTVKLPDGTEAHPNIDKGSFYSSCPHLIHRNIKGWLRTNGYTPWPSGRPPKFELELIDSNKGVFRLRDNLN